MGREVRVSKNAILVFDYDSSGVRCVVPAGGLSTVVYLDIDSEGKLLITGGSSVVGEISGEGMIDKIEKEKHDTTKEKTKKKARVSNSPHADATKSPHPTRYEGACHVASEKEIDAFRKLKPVLKKTRKGAF